MPLTVNLARRQYVGARRELARMQRELSGCDWCCGGGDERAARLRQEMDEAAQVLGPDVPEAECLVCNYHAAPRGICARCASHPHLLEYL